MAMVFKILGLVVAVVLLLAAAFLAYEPWRVHGGRFITEYMLLAGTVAVIGLIVLAISLRYG